MSTPFPGRLILAAACLLAAAAPVSAQDDPDGIARLLARLEHTLSTGDRAAFPSLFSSPADPRVDEYAAHLFTPAAGHVVVRERDRAPLHGAPAGDRQQVVIEVFAERPRTARIVTAGLELRRTSDADAWRIDAVEGFASIDTLYRLRLDPSGAFEARGFDIRSEDLRLRLEDGTVFPVASEAGVTGLVLVGRGEMHFTPRPESERSQLRIFAGRETLVTPFESAFIRLSPTDRTWHTAALVPTTPDPREVRRAQEVFERDAPKSFGVDLRDLTDTAWHLLPVTGDFLAEIRTRRHGALTYSRAAAQMEDISLFQRDERRTIALYASTAKLEARGRFYSDDAMREYDVLEYDVEATIEPERELLGATVGLRLRARTAALSHVTLRLAEPLAVTSVTSPELGRLLHVRVRGQDTILVGLPGDTVQGATFTLVITYAGRLPGQEIAADGPQPVADPLRFMSPLPLEPYYLLSGRSYWYPQSPVPGHARAALRITVPEGYTGVATGAPVTLETASLQEWLALARGDTFVFRTRAPVRYLALLVSRFTRAAGSTLVLDDGLEPGTDAVSVDLVVLTPRGRQGRGRAILEPFEDIVRFYASLLGDVPYRSLTVALLDSELPGGHSPAYFVALNEPVERATLTWRNDPAAFDGFPDFFLAHEIAHQWWGQAVAGKNYHEQWISEGFAQYFAALYAEAARGERVLTDMLRQFRRTALARSDAGPVHLGHRIGHIRRDSRAHRAVVYNKGAGVLHMLRRLVGDAVFSEAIRQFYADWRFGQAGTDDLRRTVEAASGLDLERFFDGWIHSDDIPRVHYSTRIEPEQVTVRFEQRGARLFDVPVTVTMVYREGHSEDRVIRVAEAAVESVLPVSGAVRQVQINRDSAALAEFSR